MTKTDRIKQLINTLNQASNDYYNATPTMSDYDWDKHYEELKALEEETGIIYANSPTRNVGYIVQDKQREVYHNHPMLSLDKCHSEEELIAFSTNKICILSVKADGLTTSLRYLDGVLVSAETRGNGISGIDCLENVKTIKNVPLTIPYKEELVIDGETIIDWDNFKEINDNLPSGVEKYKHPRNLVSGSLGLLDSGIAASRNMRFIAWRVIKGLNNKSVFFALKDVEKLGFEVIPMWQYNNSTDKDNLTCMLNTLQTSADSLGIPYDGAVMAIDDVEYAKSLGRTDKFYRHSIAYKYEDELYETELIDVEWNTSKTGLINPVAHFKPTVIDGATVERATLHNLSYIENLQLGYGDKIRVYKANMIIPKVHDNLTRSNTVKIPISCPCCGAKVEEHNENGSKTLYCTNDNCQSKLLGKLVHFVSKNAINIDGFSEATIEKFMERGWLKSFSDIYSLDLYRENIADMDGFGWKSANKLIDAITESRNTTLERFIYALSIPLIGRSASRDIAKMCGGDIEVFIEALQFKTEKFMDLDGFGESMLRSLYCADVSMIQNLSNQFIFEKPKAIVTDSYKNLSGKTFVITGSLEVFKNREEAITEIQILGGKVAGSVSKNTDYLVNNDINSTSGKNKKAKELGIPIISEQELIEMVR